AYCSWTPPNQPFSMALRCLGNPGRITYREVHWAGQRDLLATSFPIRCGAHGGLVVWGFRLEMIKERLRGLCFLSVLHRCRSGALRHVERVDGCVQPGAAMTRTGDRWRLPDRSIDRHVTGNQ
ncbi:hypothetical protein, partial [Xanthomonas euvesicatoria]|uniref:hypothetical protein n=1 Tax=Xanthomonas euvesicatoria TaxID=456327 RepID=UPI001C449B6A